MMRKALKKISLGFFGLLAFFTLSFGVFGLSTTASAQWSNGGQFQPGEQGQGGVGVVGDEQMQEGRLIDTIKNFINWILGMLALIALGILLWGGFQMVTAAGDENKYKKGFTILKQAGIGLAFIALSWLIVSLIFYVIGVAATPGTGAGGA